MEAERMDGGAERFEAALRAAGAQHFGREVWEELVQRYGESWRHYHTLEHVADCLERLDAWKSLAQRPEEVELALWFHDAIYVPWKGSNEEKSAELARRRLEALGVPAERRERIASYILATGTHEPADGDLGLLLDLDLSILGAPADRFDLYEQQIRGEYAFVPRPLYRRQRRARLQELLARPTIFNHPPIRAALEAQARENLQRLIDQLG